MSEELNRLLLYLGTGMMGCAAVMLAFVESRMLRARFDVSRRAEELNQYVTERLFYPYQRFLGRWQYWHSREQIQRADVLRSCAVQQIDCYDRSRRTRLLELGVNVFRWGVVLAVCVTLPVLTLHVVGHAWRPDWLSPAYGHKSTVDYSGMAVLVVLLFGLIMLLFSIKHTWHVFMAAHAMNRWWTETTWREAVLFGKRATEPAIRRQLRKILGSLLQCLLDLWTFWKAYNAWGRKCPVAFRQRVVCWLRERLGRSRCGLH